MLNKWVTLLFIIIYFILYDNYVATKRRLYNIHYMNAATPPFYSLKANCWHLITWLIYCQFV